MSDSLSPHGLYRPWNSLGQNTGVCSLSLHQGMFPTQGLNPGFPHCRQILYQMSLKGSPRTQGWVAYPFSSRSSQPRNRTLYQLSYQGSNEESLKMNLDYTMHIFRQSGFQFPMHKWQHHGYLHKLRDRKRK